MKGKSNIKGYIYVIQAFIMWGVLAVYWKQLKHIGDWELITHRIIWSFLMLTAFLAITKKSQIKTIWLNSKHRNALLTTAALIAVNWGVFIYAVNADKIVQAGLGYYITPLVNVFLGVVILKERLTKLKIIALALVSGAIIFLTIQLGYFPYISFVLAFSFGFYGLIKKTTKVETLPSLTFETTVLFPFALGYQVYMHMYGGMSFTSHDSISILLLIGTGIITILPLYWFTNGAKLINLTTVGFFQYLGPTIMLLIGVFVYNEPFKTNEIIAFSIIWLAIGLYIYSLVNEDKKKKI
ncbi:EamA family transporter RarD [Labilibacter marinus]|uniref:EamA family transporter RarD n=1 Tax=Labilibacter marinus TaxID=1477105 RepID=UPI00094FD990|nr:EamA family transporter RarD [Labilibacter marinus]